MSSDVEEKPETEFVQFKKINIRDLYKISKCGTGLHIWIPKHVIEHFFLERGDQLWIKVEEVRYHNLREVPTI